MQRRHDDFRVIQIVPYLRVESAGTSYAVSSICRALDKAGSDVTLCTTGGLPSCEYPFRTYNFPETPFPHPKFCRSPELLRFLRGQCLIADVVCVNSIWTYPNVYPAWAKKGTKCKLVTAPMGTMSEWAWNYHRPQKRAFGLYAQYGALAATDMWYATAESEYKDIRRHGYRQPVCILPHGVDLPALEPEDCARAHSERAKFGEKSTRRRM